MEVGCRKLCCTIGSRWAELLPDLRAHHCTRVSRRFYPGPFSELNTGRISRNLQRGPSGFLREQSQVVRNSGDSPCEVDAQSPKTFVCVCVHASSAKLSEAIFSRVCTLGLKWA